VELGGALLMEPLDVFTSGRMALIQDPTGAPVALWEGRDHPGFGLVGQPGTPCWLELMTSDPDRARAFYSRLLPWEPEEMQVTGAHYTVFHRAGEPTAGMMRTPEEAGGAPSHWLVYFYAADSDATAARTRELGGQVLVPPTDIPGIGRFAVLQDPQGAMFCLLTPLPQG
jgi:predicted enzyme related to lactoylglutathione lyase